MKKFQMMMFLLIGIMLLTGCSKRELSDDVKDCNKPYKGDWTIVWCDEFDYEGAIDSDKWSHELGAHGWGNQELQNYTNSELNSYVDDGNLVISAIKTNNQWTSARIRTLNKGDWKYGRFEIKAKLPSGVGTWPAIWMLPTDWVYGGWPDSGEIDIMEHVGRDLNKVFGTVHTAKYNHNAGSGRGKTVTLDDVVNDYHVYAIEWYPQEIKYFIDDEHYFTYEINEKLDGGANYHEAWPFDQDFHLILNIAIGGKFGGPVESNLDYAEMVVDYVRVYEYTAKDKDKPSKPTINNEDTRIRSNQVLLNWDDSTDDTYIESYEIYLNNELVKTSSFSFASITDLTANTEYDFEIVAIDSGGNRSNTETVTIKTLDYPQAPGKIDAILYAEKNGGRIINSADEDGGEAIGYIKKNESITYQVNVKETGNYLLSLRIASLDGDADLEIYVDGTKQAIYDLPRTGGWRNWQTIQLNEPIYLEEGMTEIKLVGRMSNTVKDAFWINWLELVKE